MVSANECMLSGYFGCRQQCLYGCFLFIDICFVSWGSCQHAWYRLGKSCGFGWWVRWIERKIRQGTCFRICDLKTHSFFIFDIVNTKNPSGGMIGPGNCQWLHNTLLFLSGAIGPGTQKLLKNHAAVHNACGFVLTHTDIRSGYFPQNAVNVSSAGATRNGADK